MTNHGLIRDNAFTQAHIVDELVWVSHELFVVTHHLGNGTCEND